MTDQEWAAAMEVAAPGGTTADFDEATAEEVTDRLEANHGVVMFGPDRVSATFNVRGTTPSRAIATAQVTFKDALNGTGADRWPVVAAEVLTLGEQIRRLDEPAFPELVGLLEAAEILGVSKQRVGQLDKEHAGFPSPLQRLRSGPVWSRHAIEAFDERWERRSGRPPKHAA